MTKRARIRAFKRVLKAVGGTGVLAIKLNTDQSRVSNWKKRGVPDREVLAVEAATKDEHGKPKVSRQELAPHLYPKDDPLVRKQARRSTDVHAQT